MHERVKDILLLQKTHNTFALELFSVYVRFHSMM